MKRLCTFDPKLYLAGNLVVVPATGDVIIYGKSTAQDKLAFHIYHYNPNTDRLSHRIMKDVCEHDFYVRYGQSVFKTQVQRREATNLVKLDFTLGMGAKSRMKRPKRIAMSSDSDVILVGNE